MKTPRTAALPSFYTHVIGSLPRPRVVQHLLAQQGTMPADAFNARMDEMVTFAIRLQELAGIDVVSDGEWRRSHYIGEFLSRVGGFAKVREYEHQGERKKTLVAVERMAATEPVFVRDAAFLAQHSDHVTKYALPSPFLIVVRMWHEDYSKAAYPTPQHLLEHLTEVLTAEAKAIAAAGIDVIQLDDPALTYFCDARLMKGEAIHDERLRRHWDADTQVAEAVASLNAIAEAVPAAVHVHACHSVYKRQSDVIGNYKPLLPRLKDLHVDQINLEFAYHGTGEADDLTLLPTHLNVGMGVVDVRSDQLQTVEQMAAIGEAGTKLIAPSRISLNPDCGFAPDAGEPPTIDEAFEKLRRLSEAAKLLRGKMKV